MKNKISIYGKIQKKGLIKCGQKEHLEALLNDGVIYMNNIDYFREYEESQQEHLRGDKYECSDYIRDCRLMWHYKIFCVNGNTGFKFESRIFYFIDLQNEEDYEGKESSSAR